MPTYFPTTLYFTNSAPPYHTHCSTLAHLTLTTLLCPTLPTPPYPTLL